jgi:ubiquinone/menaquinone biosynthesis C-methylase UbiE
MDYNQLDRSIYKWNNESNLTQWDYFYHQDNYNGNRLRARERKLLQYFDSLSLPKGAKILDLGCGAGVTSAKILQRGYSVVGIDVSQKLLDIARTNCSSIKSEGSYKFVEGNVEALPFADESFDCVIGLGFMQYLEKPGRCVLETSRVLKRGGYFILGQRNMFGISSLDGPLKLMRAFYYVLSNRRYEFRWQDTLLLYPALFITFSLSPFSKFITKKYKYYKDHKTIGFVKKNAWSYRRLNKLLGRHLNVISAQGAGYLSKKSKVFYSFFHDLDKYFQKKVDSGKGRLLRKIGNSTVILARKE